MAGGVCVAETHCEPREGLHIVRIDSQLFVKRVQRAGPTTLMLASANSAYPPFEIDLERDGDGFAVMGKGVWMGRSL